MIKKSALSFLFILACGCQVVFFKYPLTPQNQSAPDKGLLGIWAMTENNKKLFVIIRRQNDNLLNLQMIENEFKFDPQAYSTAYTSDVGKEKFINVLSYDKNKKPDSYLIAHYALDNNGDRLIIRLFDYDIFTKAVQDKKIKGTISMVDFGKTKSPSMILITDSAENVVSFLKGKRKEDFLGEKVLVFDRVK